MKTDEHYRMLAVTGGFTAGSSLENITAHTISRAAATRGIEQQHRVGPYRLDFAWPDLKVALEVDGPTHFAPSKAAHDAVRDSALRTEGWLVFRVDAEHGRDALVAQVAEVCRVVHMFLRYGR